MNTNGQILHEVNILIDKCRRIGSEIKRRREIIASLSGGNQKEKSLSIDGLGLSITETNRSYTYSPKKHYKLAVTFIKKGLHMEIQELEDELRKAKEELNNFNIGNMF